MSGGAIRHAGLVALRLRGRWTGMMVEGPSGAGKSDLALRLLEHGFRLVADDRVLTWVSEGRLWGRAPETLSGLIEARGVGILAVEPVAFAEIALVVRLGAPERLPEPETETICGVAIPVLTADPFALSAPAKLRRALETFDAAHKNGI